MLKTASTVTINTGNVLNLIDIKKKAGQNVVEELSESIKLTLSEWKKHPPTNGPAVAPARTSTSPPPPVQPAPSTPAPSTSPSTAPPSTAPSGPELTISRPTDDVKDKMAEEERKNFKIGVKVFINEDNVGGLTECLESVFTALMTESIDNVILSYNPPSAAALPDSTASLRTPLAAGSAIVKMSNTDIDADNEADALKCDTLLPGIKVLWQVLEDYVKKGRVSQLGVADTGGGCLRRLHAWARVRPSIAQINLASCCVVPPALHAFCRANHVQLLTHADPPDLLTAATTKALDNADLSCQTMDWCARYQVHIKCRGVLALKGYVCRASVRKTN